MAHWQMGISAHTLCLVPTLQHSVVDRPRHEEDSCPELAERPPKVEKHTNIASDLPFILRCNLGEDDGVQVWAGCTGEKDIDEQDQVEPRECTWLPDQIQPNDVDSAE